MVAPPNAGGLPAAPPTVEPPKKLGFGQSGLDPKGFPLGTSIIGCAVGVTLDPSVMGFGVGSFSLVPKDSPCSRTGVKGHFDKVAGAACDSVFLAIADPSGLLSGEFSELIVVGTSGDDDLASFFFLVASCFSASSFLASATA